MQTPGNFYWPKFVGRENMGKAFCEEGGNPIYWAKKMSTTGVKADV
jgi:hypothetical protein